MKKHLYFASFIIFALLCITCIAQAKDPSAEAKLTDYDVSLVTLQPTVTKNIQGKTIEYKEGYLVRLHGAFPTQTAKTMELYIGSERIFEYGGLPDGIYFIIYEKSRLDTLSEKPFKYRFGKGKIHSLGKIFDPGRFEPFKKKPEKEALTEK